MADSVISIENNIFVDQIDSLIKEGHSVTIIVRGNSMNPFIVDRRDKVILSPVKESDLKKGDFVLAKDDMERYVLHRIIKRAGDVIYLFGDGNTDQMEISSTERVVGKITTILRKGKSYSVDGFTWRCYSAFWMGLKPVRRYILGVWRRL